MLKIIDSALAVMDDDTTIMDDVCLDAETLSAIEQGDEQDSSAAITSISFPHLSRLNEDGTTTFCRLVHAASRTGGLPSSTTRTASSSWFCRCEERKQEVIMISS